MRSAWRAATLAVLLVAAACGGGGAPSSDGGEATSQPESVATEAAAGDGGEPGDVVITITDDGFEPAELAVPATTRIVVRNGGTTEHSLISDDVSSFNTDLLEPGTEEIIYAVVPGMYPFHCEAHPEETGTLTIEE